MRRGREVLDFTSSLYLGLRHASESLPPWPQLTTGLPQALGPLPGADGIAARLARLQNCEAATLGPSTLHLFWDLFTILAAEQPAIYVDAGAYPIARLATAGAAVRGVEVHRFGHGDVAALAQSVRRLGRVPVVVADGICPCCGKPAPIRGFLDAIRPSGGFLVLDDTQGLGILGSSPGREAPYGWGGGGALRHCGVSGPDIVLVSSLAKAFGAPVAALSGSQALVARFEELSATRVHCSPPSIPAIAAARQALDLNDRFGDRLRLKLARAVQRLNGRLKAAGLAVTGGFFPVQALPAMPVGAGQKLHARLLESGIHTVLQGSRDGTTGRIAFVLSTDHRQEDIDMAVDILLRETRKPGFPGTRFGVARAGWQKPGLSRDLPEETDNGNTLSNVGEPLSGPRPSLPRLVHGGAGARGGGKPR